jgi:phospholipase C
VGRFYDHVAPPRAIAPNTTDPDVQGGKALLGFRVPCVIASPWTKGNPNSPTVNHTVFDHTSVLKLIESVFSVAPLAAREQSTDVGNLLTALNLSTPQASLPSLPQPGYTFPSSFCFSSIDPANVPAGVVSAELLPARPTTVREDEESNTFMQMISSGMLQGFPGQ